MARSAKSSRPVATFTHSLKFEVHRSKFMALDSARHLDLDKLGRVASSEIELGYLEGGCCQRLVSAILRKGMVTKLELSPCADRPPMKISADLAGLLKTAGHRVRPKARRGPRLPLPIRDFMSNLQTVAEETIYCIHLCFLGHCIWCCFYWEGDFEPAWGYLDCEGWIIGPIPPQREARARSASVRRGSRGRTGLRA
jgi:hypothetical protein